MYVSNWSYKVYGIKTKQRKGERISLVEILEQEKFEELETGRTSIKLWRVREVSG